MRALYRFGFQINFSRHVFRNFCAHLPRYFSYAPNYWDSTISLAGKDYKTDSFTNLTRKIVSNIDRKLYLQKHHPLFMIKQRIINFMYNQFKTNRGNPLFSVHENLSPCVTVEQNFDNVLIPEGHPSRSTRDNYYINSEYVLRGHTTAHQKELILLGLDNFLVVGDVYRRDTIDSRHYPIFHQLDAVRLCSSDDIFRINGKTIDLFEDGVRTENKQESHTIEAAKFMEEELKRTLEGLIRSLFGNDVKYQWISAKFPFTHPSWEIEILHNEKWVEVLGCGIMEQKIPASVNCANKIGWAFGLGLERLAMILYKIPDIRLFWSKDTGFLSQFETNDVYAPIIYKPISSYPQCINDISFWISSEFKQEDFFDLIRDVGGEIIEQVKLVDEYVHPKSGQVSHCYRIIYRHMERTLTKSEVNIIHKRIENESAAKFNVIIR